MYVCMYVYVLSLLSSLLPHADRDRQREREREMSDDVIVMYGAEHSPWTQAVAMGCHLKGLRVKCVHAPGFWNFMRGGLVLPSIWIQRYGSTETMRTISGSDMALIAIDELRGSGVTSSTCATPGMLRAREMYESNCAWVEHAEELFAAYVGQRIDFGVFHFLHAWAKMPAATHAYRSTAHLFVQACARSLPALYFCVLLLLATRVFKLRRNTRLLHRNIAWWTARLEESNGPYLSGQTIGIADLLLFGHMQTIATDVGGTAEVLDEFYREAPALRSWLELCLDELGDDYEWCHFRAKPRASGSEQAIFWASLVLLLTLLLPVTAVVLMYAFTIRNTNVHRGLRTYAQAVHLRRMWKKKEK